MRNWDRTWQPYQCLWLCRLPGMMSSQASCPHSSLMVWIVCTDETQGVRLKLRQWPCSATPPTILPFTQLYKSSQLRRLAMRQCSLECTDCKPSVIATVGLQDKDRLVQGLRVSFRGMDAFSLIVMPKFWSTHKCMTWSSELMWI